MLPVVIAAAVAGVGGVLYAILRSPAKADDVQTVQALDPNMGDLIARAVATAGATETNPDDLQKFGNSLLPEFPNSAKVLTDKGLRLGNVPHGPTVAGGGNFAGEMSRGASFGNVFSDALNAFTDMTDAIGNIPGIKQVGGAFNDFTHTTFGKAFMLAMGPIMMTELLTDLPGVGLQIADTLGKAGPLLNASLPGLARGERVDVAFINGAKNIVSRLGSSAGAQITPALDAATAAMKQAGFDPQQVLNEADKLRAQAGLTSSTQVLPPELQVQFDDFTKNVRSHLDAKVLAAKAGVSQAVMQLAIDGVTRSTTVEPWKYDANGNELPMADQASNMIDQWLLEIVGQTPVMVMHGIIPVQEMQGGSVRNAIQTVALIKQHAGDFSGAMGKFGNLQTIIDKIHRLAITPTVTLQGGSIPVFHAGSRVDVTAQGTNLTPDEQKANDQLDAWLTERLGGKVIQGVELHGTIPVAVSQTVGYRYRNSGDVLTLAKMHGGDDNGAMGRFANSSHILDRIHALSKAGRRSDETPVAAIDPITLMPERTVAELQAKAQAYQARNIGLQPGSAVWQQNTINYSLLLNKAAKQAQADKDEAAYKLMMASEPTTSLAAQQRATIFQNSSIQKQNTGDLPGAAMDRMKYASYMALSAKLAGGNASAALASALTPAELQKLKDRTYYVNLYTSSKVPNTAVPVRGVG